MQLVVVSAVMNAVSAATIIFTAISIIFVFFMVFLIFQFSSLGPFLSFVLQVKCKVNAEPSSLELC